MTPTVIKKQTALQLHGRFSKTRTKREGRIRRKTIIGDSSSVIAFASFSGTYQIILCENVVFSLHNRPSCYTDQWFAIWSDVVARNSYNIFSQARHVPPRFSSAVTVHRIRLDSFASNAFSRPLSEMRTIPKNLHVMMPKNLVAQVKRYEHTLE